jgi:GNAT superfamily N-acetyltransferase
MLTSLPDIVLRTGETMRVHVLRPPEPGPADRLLAALGHKGAPWHADIADRLAGRLAACSLDTYIVGEIGDSITGTIWVTVPADTRDVGTLGHVFTDPRHRQKGICDHLLAALLELLRREGVAMVHLATGNPVAARIYERHGFRQCNGGIYRWTADADAVDAYFTPRGPLIVRPVHRGDMPRFEALYNAGNPWLLHDESLRVQAGTGFEGQFLAA